MQDVMLVATRKENVDTREAALKNAGLVPVIVDIEAVCLGKLIPSADGLLAQGWWWRVAQPG
jgi:Tfp pilus assembly PilM family ATPase